MDGCMLTRHYTTMSHLYNKTARVTKQEGRVITLARARQPGVVVVLHVLLYSPLSSVQVSILRHRPHPRASVGRGAPASISFSRSSPKTGWTGGQKDSEDGRRNHSEQAARFLDRSRSSSATCLWVSSGRHGSNA